MGPVVALKVQANLAYETISDSVSGCARALSPQRRRKCPSRTGVHVFELWPREMPELSSRLW